MPTECCLEGGSNSLTTTLLKSHMSVGTHHKMLYTYFSVMWHLYKHVPLQSRDAAYFSIEYYHTFKVINWKKVIYHSRPSVVPSGEYRVYARGMEEGIHYIHIQERE